MFDYQQIVMVLREIKDALRGIEQQLIIQNSGEAPTPHRFTSPQEARKHGVQPLEDYMSDVGEISRYTSNRE